MSPDADPVRTRADEASDPVAAAREAAGAGPLAQRVSELETALASERAAAARRLKEMDGLMRRTRSALQDLQTEFRRTASERDELRERLETRDEEVHELETRVTSLRQKAERAVTERDRSTAEVVAAAVARAQKAETELSGARATIADLEERLSASTADHAATSALADLQETLAERDAELRRLEEQLADREAGHREDDGRAVSETQEFFAPSVTGSPAPEESVEDDPADSGSTYLAIDDDEAAAAPRRRALDTDSDSTYIPIEGGDEMLESLVRDSAPAVVDDGLSESTFIPILGEDEDSVPRGPTIATDTSTRVPVGGEDSDAAAPAASADAAGAAAADDDHDADDAGTPSASGTETVHGTVTSSGQTVDGASGAPHDGSPPDAPRPAYRGLSLEREVGRGEDGILVHATDPEEGGDLVLCVLPEGTEPPSDESAERLLTLRHPNVVSVVRCEVGPHGPYLGWERPTGERVDAWIKRVGRVAEPIALAVTMQVARGLREAAARGVHHGDVSPGFLWTDADGVVRVAAFGLQDALPDRAPRAPLPFVAPERLAGAEPDERSDMYSLAACLRYLAGGPSAAEDEHGLHRVDPPVSAALIEVADIIGAIERDERPQSWDEVLALLEVTLCDCVAARKKAAEPPSTGGEDDSGASDDSDGAASESPGPSAAGGGPATTSPPAPAAAEKEDAGEDDRDEAEGERSSRVGLVVGVLVVVAAIAAFVLLG